MSQRSSRRPYAPGLPAARSHNEGSCEHSTRRGRSRERRFAVLPPAFPPASSTPAPSPHVLPLVLADDAPLRRLRCPRVDPTRLADKRSHERQVYANVPSARRIALALDATEDRPRCKLGSRGCSARSPPSAGAGRSTVPCSPCIRSGLPGSRTAQASRPLPRGGCSC